MFVRSFCVSVQNGAMLGVSRFSDQTLFLFKLQEILTDKKKNYAGSPA